MTKTKTPASNRKLVIGHLAIDKLQAYLRLNPLKSSHDPIFISHKVDMVSVSINKALTQKLTDLKLPRITFHGLRHTHASILLYQGISVLSVSKRLGHSSITTTQSTYLHIIKELENQDNEKILAILEK